MLQLWFSTKTAFFTVKRPKRPLIIDTTLNTEVYFGIYLP